MDKIQALYQSYLDAGIISPSTTLEQFATANEEQLSTLYNQGIESNFISSETNIDLFTSAWGLKKKDASVTVSESESGLSGQQKYPPGYPYENYYMVERMAVNHKVRGSNPRGGGLPVPAFYF